MWTDTLVVVRVGQLLDEYIPFIMLLDIVMPYARDCDLVAPFDLPNRLRMVRSSFQLIHFKESAQRRQRLPSKN